MAISNEGEKELSPPPRQLTATPPPRPRLRVLTSLADGSSMAETPPQQPREYLGTCRSRCNSRKHCSCRRIGYSCLPQCHVGHSCSNTDTVYGGPTIDLTSVKDGDNKDATPSQNWVKCGKVLQLRKKDRIINSGEWLNDLINISAAQNLLRSEHPFVGGFQNPVLAEKWPYDSRSWGVCLSSQCRG